MNTAEFRKKFVPLTQSLKSEGEKLQAAYTEIHDQYVTLSDEMRTLNEAPPHSSELVVLLRDALDQLAAVRNRNFETFIQPWKNRPLSSREDYRKLFNVSSG